LYSVYCFTQQTIALKYIIFGNMHVTYTCDDVTKVRITIFLLVKFVNRFYFGSFWRLLIYGFCMLMCCIETAHSLESLLSVYCVGCWTELLQCYYA